MPWWGWLIVAGMSLIALYYLIVFVFFAKVFRKASKGIDRVTRQPGGLFGDKDPFDDPFFKDPFGRGETRKPHDGYL